MDYIHSKHIVTYTYVLPCFYRLLTERAELPFCVDGSWASGARVERDGSGLIQVWSRQIQQLNRVSPAVASAVTAAYPSPQLLLQVHRRQQRWWPGSPTVTTHCLQPLLISDLKTHL